MSYNPQNSDAPAEGSYNVGAYDALAVQYLYGSRDPAGTQLGNLRYGDEHAELLIGSFSDANVLWGLGGDDTISGRASDDSIMAGDGDDSVVAGDGDDLISGNDGNDTIRGGNGADQFHFSSNGGSDIVTDFNPDDGDRLVVSGEIIDAHQTVDGNLLVTLESASITLIGVQLADWETQGASWLL